MMHPLLRSFAVDFRVIFLQRLVQKVRPLFFDHFFPPRVGSLLARSGHRFARSHADLRCLSG